MDFCTSRMHSTRRQSCAASISKVIATLHDLPEHLPPYSTLWRQGSNKPDTLPGKFTAISRISRPFSD